MKLLDSVHSRNLFERELERVRRWYGFYVTGYVVMPEHVHLLISEPERSKLSVAIQMLKRITSRKLRPPKQPRFWQIRYYDFSVWSEAKRIEKLRYIHRNPLKRGLVVRPEDWPWSSFRQWARGEEGTVEIECPSTARKRERMGAGPTVVIRSHPSPKSAKGWGNLAKNQERKGWASPPNSWLFTSAAHSTDRQPRDDSQ